MSPIARGATGLLLSLVLVPLSRAQSPQEEARRKLLEQMGLDKAPSAPKPPQPPPEQEPPPPPTPPAAEGTAAAATPPPPPAIPFAGRVHEALLTSCRVCHVAGGMAAASHLVLTGNLAADHAGARKLVDLGSPRRSLLLSKATGNQHGGGPTITTASETYRRLLSWISTGAELHARPAAAAAGGVLPVPVPVARPVRAPRPGSALPIAPVVPAVPLPAPPGSSGPDAAEMVAVNAGAAVGPGGTAPPAPAAPTPHPAALALHAAMATACLPCHRPPGPGAMSRYKLGGAFTTDLTASRAFVVPGQPASSPLVNKAAGQVHGGGAPWPPGGPGQQLLLAWLEAGAPDHLPPPAPGGAGVPEAAASAPAPPAADAAPPVTAAPAAPAHPAGIPLLGDTLMLNGRFDLNLERRAFDANPWGQGSQTALQSYHRFLFLSRQSAEDPLTFSAELISLEFYEVGLRLGPRQGPARLHLRGGKLLVPFGTEPLFHQSYGGHQGFDQRVLPPIWAAEGLAATGQLEAGLVTMTADLYGVRGHELRTASAVLNLQSDFSTTDDARPAAGLRLGAAVGPLSGFYSAYFNPLGHDRRLFMQALDVSLWRWRHYPVLDRLVLAAGALRADISGVGSPGDSYHFASYWLLRVYPLRWLHLQYRQGLRTFDNKRNLTYDGRRAGSEDGSTHNLAVGARYRGLSLGLAYYLNLEKAAEVNDDLLRLSVAYEF